MTIENPSRRHAIHAVGRMMIIPLGSALGAIVGPGCQAASNPAVRKTLAYQGTPDGDRQCSNCLEFVAGSNETAPGRCKLIPDDDEIAPTGFCKAWNTL